MKYSLSDKFDFGKYKGWSLNDIWIGWEFPTEDFFKDFIAWRISKAENYEFFNGKQNPINLKITDFQITNNDIQIHFNNQTTISSQATTSYLNIIFGAAERYPEKNFFDPVNDFIIEQVIDLNRNYRIFADPDYIIWCLKDNDKFCISMEDLERLKQMPCNFFKGLIISLKSDNIYQYSANIFKSPKKVGIDTIEDINEEKLSQFSETQNSHEIDRFSYETYGGIFGLDDDSIDSAFEGDPSNYWNVD